ncbi:MAG TPA: hypothetical protein VN441_15440 [Syntrophomonas sp.]|nr:hypothetical protein [Syntrophomonas sp.]
MTADQKKKLYKRLVSPAFYLALLGACKLVLNAFDIAIITDEQINAVANGLATLFVMVGIAIGYDVGE